MTVIGFMSLWLFLLSISTGICKAQENRNNDLQDINHTTDSTTIILQEVEITSSGPIGVAKGGSMSLSTSDLFSARRVMGEADVLNYIKHLSGVTTGGDYGSGIMIDGFMPSQSLFAINKVPVFFPYRFGGIFSTFNSSHFSDVKINRGFHDASMPNRLGAYINFSNANKIRNHIGGTFNIGVLSSAGTLTIPFTQKFQITLSGRISYADLLLRLLFKDSYDLRYNFYDLNLNAIWKLDENNTLSANAFQNNDNLKYKDSDFAMSDVLAWGNNLYSLNWVHSGNVDMNHRIYYSGFRNRLEIEMPQLSIGTKSKITMTGLAGDISHWIKQHSVKLTYGYELNLYRETPQKVSLSGYEELDPTEVEPLHPIEARIFAETRIPIISRLFLNAGLSGSYYHNQDDYNSFSLDPRITLNYTTEGGNFSLHFGRYSQFLHQVGFSQIGLSSDFWLTSRRSVPAQHSYDISLGYTGMSGFFSYSFTAYWRRVLKQPDYMGEIIDLVDASYNAVDKIHVFNGHNLGINAIGILSIGSLKTQLGVGYGIARRKDPVSSFYFRGSTEPGFTCNADVNYELNPHWELGAQFRFATGRPFTPVTAIYIIAENIVKEYGQFNSSRFPATHQLDLSATWKTQSKIKNTTLTHLLNFSFINAYGHRNVEIITYAFDFDSGKIYLRKVYSLYRFLPSIAYTLQF